MEKENRTKKQYNLRMADDILSMIETHMEQVNCQSKNEFIEKAIRWYCAKLDGETNDEIVTPEMIKAIKAVVRQENNRLTKIMYKNAVSTAMLVRFVSAISVPDISMEDMNFDRLRAKAVKDVKETNGNLNIQNAFYDELDASNEE